MSCIASIRWSLLLLCLAGAPASAEKRIALVIGNSSYKYAGTVSTAKRDAEAVAEMFKKVGYDVSLLTDADNLQFKRNIRKFEDAASDADIAVIFYAGHGIEIGGTNYVIPTDAKLASDRDAPDEAIELTRIIQSVDGAKRLRLVVLDACRDNPFLATMKRQRQALHQVASGLGPVGDVGSETLVAYAAKQGLTAEDGKGDHSPFTTAILHSLPEPGLDIRLAFGRVRDEVLKITNNRQEPYVYGSLGGSNVALVPAPEKAAPQAVDQEKMRTDYELVMKVFEKVGSKTPLKVFLEQYPSGLYSELVREQLNQLETQEKLALATGPSATQSPRGPTLTDPARNQQLVAIPQKEPPSPAQPSPDKLAWDEVKDSTDPDALRRFIQRFRDSPRMLEAQRRLDVLLRNQREREDQARREKAEAEIAKAWEAVQGTDDQAKLRDFLRRYPTTQFTDAAKQRLDAVIRAAQEREEAARVAAAEERRLKAEAEMKRAFDAAAATSDQSVVRDFMRRYPDSPYVAQAKSHLDALIVAEQERKEQERLAAAEARRQKMEADAAAAWNGVKNSSNPADVQNFIRRFPESTLALKDATERLGTLDRGAKERVARAQAEVAAARAAWDRIKDTNDTAVVQDFIKRYANMPTALNDAKQYLDVLDKRNKEREAKARMEAEAAQAWNRIQSSTDQAELRNFIKRYPDAAVTLTDAAPRLAALEHEAADRAEKARAEAAAVRAAWELVKGSNDLAELRDYINKYPDSPFSTRDAKARIDLLERQAKEREAKEKAEAAAREAKEKAEAEMREAWDATRDSRDPSELRAFIRRYPSSPFVTDANQSIAALEPKPEVTAKPEAEPDVSTRPINRQRPEITIRTAPPAPVQPRPEYHPRPEIVVPPAPPPPKVVERHHEKAPSEGTADGQLIPEFPWPPPPASGFYVIPRELLVHPFPGTVGKASLSDIVKLLEHALEQAAYYERSFYSVPGGIAMVTRMERIKKDGSPDESKRWIDMEDRQSFSILDYINSLLFSDPGLFRLIVFVISDRPFVPAGPKLSARQAKSLLSHGMNAAPQPLLDKAFVPEHQVSVLIYEFEKQQNKDAKQITPSPIPARIHLEKSLVWAGIDGSR
jgi:outer membrane protein assembly factor BamD (BamD/ComL family)